MPKLVVRAPKWKLTYDAEKRASRTDPLLIECVETLGEKANGESFGTGLIIVSVPDDVEWQIDEHDGFEWVAEQHRTWPPRDE